MTLRPARLSTIAAACSIAVVVLWFAANDDAGGRRLDATIDGDLRGLFGDAAHELLQGASSLADTAPFAVGAAGLVGLAWLRGPRTLALWTAIVLLAANGMTQLAQPSLTAARHVDVSGTLLEPSGSWPSGHATAAMTLALCAIVVASPRLRAVTAVVGLAYALGVGGALIALGGHLPSDVLAAYLVAAAFTAAGLALYVVLMRRRETTVDSRPVARAVRSPRRAPAFGLLAGSTFFATGLGKAFVTRQDEVASAIDNLPLALAALGVLTVVVVVAAALVLRR